MSKMHFMPSLFALGWLMLVGGAASGQNYPARPIHIFAAAAGGSGDVAARLIGQGLLESLGQQVVVDNRAGSIVVPAELVAKAPADGYTLFVHSGTLWITPLLQKVPYDAERDFAPVTLISSSPDVLVINSAVAANSIKDLVALAKGSPGSINYGTAGTGSTGHLAAELFKAMAGIDLLRVNYKSGQQARVDLISGRIQMAFFPTDVVMPHVKAGRLKVLAITSAQPSVLAPGVPTMAASGLPNYEALFILGLFAPAKTPAAIVDRLYQETARTLGLAEVKQKFLSAGAETVGSRPAEFAATIRADISRWSKVIKDAGIKDD